MAAQVLRKFGFKKSEPRESEARVKLQKELFQFNKCVDHGFLHKPSAVAYDPKLKLMAIGTKSGTVKVFGAPGVEFTQQHKDDVAVHQLIFVPEQARLVSLCSDNSLRLWEINTKSPGCAVLEEVKQYNMEASKLKTISALCLTSDGGELLIGTEGGNIHMLDVATFTLGEQIIYQDVVMQNVPDDFKVNPGAVESILQHPKDPTKFLVGYNRGLIVLWDNKANNADHTYNAAQQLESLSWYRDGTQFVSAHADGSYSTWSTADSTKPKEQPITPYGPFPCKGIDKIVWKSAKSDPFIVFSGGMPRASFGDRHTVTVMQGSDNHVVFDFTSNIIDFVILTNADATSEDIYDYDDPHTLVVLAEEEVVAIDLAKDGWPTLRLPYLNSMHSSAITCSHHVHDVSEQLWTKIVEAGEAQVTSVSNRDWPITGGKPGGQDSTTKDMLLTGHEDGSIRFWDVSTVAVKLMYQLKTSNIFGIDLHDQTNADAEEEWPPFKKVGTFDPYSDDPRLGVQKLAFCALSETLVIGGTAGQVILLQLEREERETDFPNVVVNIVGDRDNFVWKGHEALPVHSGEVKFAAGFQPVAVMQLHPPAACTALAVQSEWQLMTAGTAHGFGVFDYAKKKEVTAKCTLNPADLTGTGESAMSRRKSFKKSLRESFRRLRNKRSQAGKRRSAEPKPEETPPAATGGEQATGGAAATTPAEGTSSSPVRQVVEVGAKAVERAVEARTPDDAMGSMIRSLYFANTYLTNAQESTPTLWAGTNSGAIFVYQITLPASDKRDSVDVVCQLGKEIQLKHRAPVLLITVIDRNACPLPAAYEVQHEKAKAPDMSGGHSVVICSEEQFKIFSLPHLKAHHKHKLTAHEGAKVRRVQFVNFRSRSDENYNENDLACLTNQGELQVFTIPNLRRQLKCECIQKENVTGVNSCAFSKIGEGFYLVSPSEYARFSLSARYIQKPMCEVELKDGMRVEPEPTPEVIEVAEAAAAEQKSEGDKKDATPAEGAADTSLALAMADTTLDSANATLDTSANITADSVKVHISDEASGVTRTVESSFSAKTTVVKRTIVSETVTDNEGSSTVTSDTTVVQTASTGGDAAAPAVEAAASPGK